MSGETTAAATATAAPRRLDAFSLRDHVVDEYPSYVRGFINIADERVRAVVDEALSSGRLWPDPWLQINPKFTVGASIGDLAGEGTVHPGCAELFATPRQDGQREPFQLYHHQVEGIRAAAPGANYVMTAANED